MLKRICSALTAASVLLLSSCAKEGPTGPTGPAGPSYTGSISGHVRLYDMYGSPVLTGLSSVRVALNSGTPVNADASGYYVYNSVKTGSYTLAATDSAYAGTVLNNVNFVIGTLNQDIGLSAIPDSFITSFRSFKSTASSTDSLRVNMAASSRARNCIVFVNKTSYVGNMPAQYLLWYIIPVAANTTGLSFLIPAQDLYNAGVSSGNRVYFAAYSYVVNDASVYEDVLTGKNIYSAVNANPAIDSAVAP